MSLKSNKKQMDKERVVNILTFLLRCIDFSFSCMNYEENEITEIGNDNYCKNSLEFAN